MADVKWTPQQLQAIEGRGGNILVSAAAGSGKTAVLVERVISRLTDPEHPVDADHLLVVTFSNAAAGEMKQRISRKLWELLEENPGDPRLARQQILLDSAQISTIHSFCITLLRQHFHQLEIPADFRIADERELDVLRMDTVRQLVEEEYQKKEPGFYDLVELLSSTRSDQKLERTILRLYDFARNHPFYEEWLTELGKEWEENLPLNETPWAAILLDYAGDALRHCKALLERALELMAGDEAMENAYGPAYHSDLAQVEGLLETMASESWGQVVQRVRGVSFQPLGRLSKYEDEEKKNTVQGLRGQYKDILKELSERVFLMTEAEYHQDMAQLAPVARQLFRLTVEFGRALDAAKLDRGVLDFGDLEHGALRLLYTGEGKDRRPSEIAFSLREQYEEILVDEYQDTNGTQELIFSALAREEGNLFLVGDVKQSIYRFRQARPENFLEKKERYFPYESGRFPAKISLSANFRTRQETTGLINYLFSLVMSPKVGEMDYGPEDALYAKAAYDESQHLPVELMVVDPALFPDEDPVALEARYVAERIDGMLREKILVTDKSGPRPIEPRDICILLRTRKNKPERYPRELEARSIRYWADSQGGFLEAKEIAPVVSYLKILVNPMVDLELAQVLGSALYGFTSQQLAQVRQKAEKEPLFLGVRQLAGEGDEPCRRFLEDYTILRREALSQPAQGVIQMIYTLTGLEQKALAMPQGEVRQGNLHLLMEAAASYTGSVGGDFSDFVTYLYALEQYEEDLPSATAAAGNAVSVMSVHKSKGLEFPVVFLCDTAASFNLMDLNADVQLHPELGFACILRDNRRMLQHKTLPLAAERLENKRATLSEELRILYVAMTRARERLIITANDKGLQRMEKLAAQPMEAGKVSGWTARTASCYYDWLAAALCHHPDFPPSLLQRPPVCCRSPIEDGSLLAGMAGPETLQPREAAGTHKAPPANLFLVKKLEERLRFHYPFEEDTETPAKVSVSQLVHSGDREEYLFTRRPKLLTRQALTPTERGIAAHKFMQFADFHQAAADVEGEIARLTQRGYITPEEGKFMDRQMLRKLLEGPLGRRMLAADQLYREIRFLREFTPQELGAIDPAFQVRSTVTVQGIADCVMMENSVGTIVDYKTDLVREEETLRTRYAGQLRLYQAILEQQLDITITQRLLYSFALGKVIPV